MNDKPKTWDDLSPPTQPQPMVQPGPLPQPPAPQPMVQPGPPPAPQPTTEWWSTSDYACLRDVLRAAYDQAAIGKGAERHANNLPFEDQPMQHLIELHGVGFAAGQVSKKMAEAQGMLNRGEVSAAMREILGAIVYASGVAVYIEHNKRNE